MSIWGSIGKGLLKAIPIVGDIASGIGAGRQQGREAEADANYKRDMLALQGARLNLDAPQLRARNSVRGDLLANLQPMTITGPITHTGGQMPQMSGGMSPALLSQNSRQLGQGMSRDALLSQMQGPAFTPTALPKSNLFDKLLTGLGYAGAAKGGYDLLRGDQKDDQVATLQRPYSSNVKMPTFGGV